MSARGLAATPIPWRRPCITAYPFADTRSDLLASPLLGNSPRGRRNAVSGRRGTARALRASHAPALRRRAHLRAPPARGHRPLPDRPGTPRDLPRPDGGDAETAGLPGFKREFEAYLQCGILGHGCLHVRCERCEDEMVVAFSCKGRGSPRRSRDSGRPRARSPRAPGAARCARRPALLTGSAGFGPLTEKLRIG